MGGEVAGGIIGGAPASLGEVLARASDFLKRAELEREKGEASATPHSAPSPQLEAELILCELLGRVDRSYLFIHENDILTAEQHTRAEEMLIRRAMGEPLAYILGRKEFYGRDFRVSPAVLIPRPESEGLVRLALEWLKTVKSENSGSADNQETEERRTTREANPNYRASRVLDVGTGSGCLAISIVLETGAEALGVDISEEALALAQENAKKLGATRVKFKQSDLLAEVESPEDFDLVVANLPYVDERWNWLDKQALGYEPRLALYAEDGGLAPVKKLIRELSYSAARAEATRDMFCVVPQTPKELALILEVDESQSRAVIKYAEEYGFAHRQTDELAILLTI